MNPQLQTLHPYPFEKLSALKAGIIPPAELSHIALSIGEPKHTPPAFVIDTLASQLGALTQYPSTKGLLALRTAIANWANRRFKLQSAPLDAERQVLPVSGTREALFSFTQTVIDRTQANPMIVSPNPFYQIYEGAALLAGATPYFVNGSVDNHWLLDPDAVDQSVWQNCQLLYICSPGNPSGSVIDLAGFKKLIDLADRYNFIIASDECYSEIYFDEQHPPMGLLQACAAIGRNDYARCVVFHSLSKRSNLPGLRSGFVAGDASLLEQYLLYRTYHGSALPVPTQLASIDAWNDEQHVRQNRALYREKFTAVLATLNGCLEVNQPDAGFYLWAKTPLAGETFAQRLFAEKNITLLPGSFLAREVDGINPAHNYVRIALVVPLAECIDAAQRIKDFVTRL